jgi:aryl-alcohol dehydrogenase-like predicted oxidoreductase
VEYRKLGRTGLSVSRLGLGCGNFGGIGSAPEFFGRGESEEEAFRLMDLAWDTGINFFDTADAYAGGLSETFIGRWLRTKESRAREEVLLSTKVFNPVGEGPNDRGLSRRHIVRQAEASLRRLGVDRLDMYLTHEVDPEVTFEETLGALNDLVRAGKVHYCGASNIEAWRLVKARGVSERMGYPRYEWVQVPYSLLERGVERELIPMAAAEGIGLTPYSPLAGGWLSGKYRPGEAYPDRSRMSLRSEPYLHLVRDSTFRGLEALRRAAEERGLAMTTLAIAWVLSHPWVTAVIIGPRRPEHIHDARAALDVDLSDEERASLSAAFT